MLKVDACDVCARTFVTFLKMCPESGGVSHEAEFRCVRKTWLFFFYREWKATSCNVRWTKSSKILKESVFASPLAWNRLNQTSFSFLTLLKAASLFASLWWNVHWQRFCYHNRLLAVKVRWRVGPSATLTSSSSGVFRVISKEQSVPRTSRKTKAGNRLRRILLAAGSIPLRISGDFCNS